MLIWTGAKLQEYHQKKTLMGLSAEESMQGNTVLESFLLHARVLRDYFWQVGKGHKDYVYADDYFDNPDDWVENRGCVPKYLQENQDRMNTLLAHLSRKRLNYIGDKEWDVAEIITSLSNTWIDFFSRLPADRRVWFQKRNDDTN
jgi:hypothetical protein